MIVDPRLLGDGVCCMDDESDFGDSAVGGGAAVPLLLLLLLPFVLAVALLLLLCFSAIDILPRLFCGGGYSYIEFFVIFADQKKKNWRGK